MRSTTPRQETKQEIGGRQHLITQEGNIFVCNGRKKCPGGKGNIPQSAQDESDFHRVTGIRTGSYRVRELLEQFRSRYTLDWGGRGMGRLWRLRKIEYDDTRDCLRINASPLSLAWGMFCAMLNFAVLAIIMVIGNSSAHSNFDELIKVGLLMLTYAAICFYLIEYHVAPEVMAIKLRRKYLAQL